MSTEHRHDSKLILLTGAGTSAELSETYSLFLKLLDFCDPGFIPLFTTHFDLSTEYSVGRAENEWSTNAATDKERPVGSGEGKCVLSLYRFHDLPNFCKCFERYLAPGKGRLLIVAGYSFGDCRINEIIAREIENGMRMLVLDTRMHYKQLAESLNISNIKHKIRIENMEFGNWDDPKLDLLANILKDECRRVGI